ncbi:amino acid permease [Jatrophihabitans sp. GAS493]|uniref:amino acid permease n=1 Tax=Jatrophihabitans sp. GAS493 TaxID=1907575 RepID=UPI000BB7FCD2|nr:amino acid permease [Jatrophihabitans sp. GAS493]
MTATLSTSETAATRTEPQSDPRPGPRPDPRPDLDSTGLPERLGYRIKRRLLGAPLVSANLHEEKLSKKAALGVLSSDCISSSAYGTEEMLLVLLGAFGLSGFHILMPLTAVVLVVLLLMTLSYREVVMVYTKAGGSYVVARENFGPKVAQIASVALLIDYIVTVAVQAAAGTAAITSLVPALNGETTSLAITVGVILLLAFGNLRGIREAGKAFAAPTYLFIGMAGLVVVVGIVREIFGDLPKFATDTHGMMPIVDSHNSIISGAAIFVLLRAFANGGSSLTGLEAISNGVSAFKKPEGVNARRTLSIMSLLLGSLVLGISYLAFETHATPYETGSPTVISQVARAAFGGSLIGHVGFIAVQITTALILFTGANTPFTGFPFLANFIAEDSFLPRQLTRRGHRLAFSNGIIVLTVASLALLVGVGANVNRLVPFYAIGVFTGFTMAGLGMAKYHRTHREENWRVKFAINLSGGVVSAFVVLIFAVVKFTEGAWLVVILFPLMWVVLMRLNRRYRREARALQLVTAAAAANRTTQSAHYARHTVLVMVDRLDLAVMRGLRYAGSLRPTDVRAVHLSVDEQVSTQLQTEWLELGIQVPLQVIECSDRRLVRGTVELAYRSVVDDRAEVTVLLPRRTFRRLSQRLLHDRTADRIAEAVGRLPHVAATIVPFDTTLDARTELRLETEQQRAELYGEPAIESGLQMRGVCVPRPDGTTAIADASVRDKVTVQGRIKMVQLGTSAGKTLEAQLFDESGGMRLLFLGRTQIPGIVPGQLLRATGRVGEFNGHLGLANPRYELVSDAAVGPQHGGKPTKSVAATVAG